VKVLIFDRQNDLPINPKSIEHVVSSVLSLEERTTDEVSVYFVSTQEICKLHSEFMDDPSPTDCITFPMDQTETTSYHILGEAFICPKTALNYVEDPQDAYNELTLYLVHSLLHLLGYDDIKEEDITRMREAETRHMNHLQERALLLWA